MKVEDIRCIDLEHEPVAGKVFGQADLRFVYLLCPSQAGARPLLLIYLVPSKVRISSLFTTPPPFPIPAQSLRVLRRSIRLPRWKTIGAGEKSCFSALPRK